MSHPFGRPDLPTREDATRLRALANLAKDYATARFEHGEAAVPLVSEDDADIPLARERLAETAETLYQLGQQLAATVMIMTADGVFRRSACLIEDRVEGRT